MGFWKKLGRGFKKVGVGAWRGLKATGKGIGKGAKWLALNDQLVALAVQFFIPSDKVGGLVLDAIHIAEGFHGTSGPEKRQEAIKLSLGLLERAVKTELYDEQQLARMLGPLVDSYVGWLNESKPGWEKTQR